MPFKLLNLGRILLCMVSNDAYFRALSSGINNSKTRTYDLFTRERRNSRLVSSFFLVFFLCVHEITRSRIISVKLCTLLSILRLLDLANIIVLCEYLKF